MEKVRELLFDCPRVVNSAHPSHDHHVSLRVFLYLFYYEYRKLSVRGGGLWSFLHHRCTWQERSALGGLVEQRVLNCRDPRCAEGKRV